jgi:hypothetical protein
VSSTARALAFLVLCVVACDRRPGLEPEAARGLHLDPSSVAVPTRDDVETPESVVTVDLVERFRVTPELAERYARSYAVRKGYLVGQPSVCLALPRADARGNPISRQLILAQPGSCDSFAALLAVAHSFWEDPPPRGTPTTAELAAALRRSGQRFFTVEVAAHTFHHPLHEAQRGLPSWVLQAARDGLVDPGRCAPEGLLPPEPSRGHFELVRYRCGDASLVVSHPQRRTVALEELTATVDVTGSFRRWRQAMRARYGDRLQDRLTKLSELWSR